MGGGDRWQAQGELADHFREAQADQPEQHDREGREGEQEQDRRAPNRFGQDVLLAEEEGASGDEKSKTHPPQVARQALGGRQFLAKDRPEVAQARDKAQPGESEHWAGTRGRGRSRETTPCHDRGGPESGRAGDDFEPAGCPIAPARSHPPGRDEIADQDSADRGTRFRHPERLKDRGGAAENEHRNDESGPGRAMQGAALADGGGDRAERQREHAAGDVDPHDRVVEQAVHAACGCSAASGSG